LKPFSPCLHRKPCGTGERSALEYFQNLFIKTIGPGGAALVERGKILTLKRFFSLFEPHTEFIRKGKLFSPGELGHKLLLTTDQHELILDYRVMDQQPNDADESIGVADRLISRYGAGSIRA